HPPRSTLFPYTTLFRSKRLPLRCSCSACSSSSNPSGRLSSWWRRVSCSTCQLRHIPCRRSSLSCVSICMLKVNNGLCIIFFPPRSEEHTSELQSRENLV